MQCSKPIAVTGGEARDAVIGIHGDDRVCADLLGVLHGRHVVPYQSGVEIEHIFACLKSINCVVAETWSELEDVRPIADGPDVAL
jgi:hypothetical protein